jgi:hypothetical protein
MYSITADRADHHGLAVQVREGSRLASIAPI